jgi:hypothetical protein
MALWAQSISGNVTIDPTLPSLKAWLKALAANGPGPLEGHEGIKSLSVSSVVESRSRGLSLIIYPCRVARPHNNQHFIKPGLDFVTQDILFLLS